MKKMSRLIMGKQRTLRGKTITYTVRASFKVGLGYLSGGFRVIIDELERKKYYLLTKILSFN